jgi:hypothetical protein
VRRHHAKSTTNNNNLRTPNIPRAHSSAFFTVGHGSVHQQHHLAGAAGQPAGRRRPPRGAAGDLPPLSQRPRLAGLHAGLPLQQRRDGAGGNVLPARQLRGGHALGVALLLVDRRFSTAALSSSVPQPVVRGMVWLANVLTGGTLQFSLNVLHLCLKMYARLILVFTA